MEPTRLGGLDRLDQLALAQCAGALDAERPGELLELGEQHAFEAASGLPARVAVVAAASVPGADDVPAPLEASTVSVT